MLHRTPFVACGLTLLLSGCDFITGKEVARIDVDRLSTTDQRYVQEATLDLKAQEQVAIWSDMDLSYDGDVDLRFLVELWKDSVLMSTLEVDPMVMNITVGERRTMINGHTDRSYNAKHEVVKVDADGRYTFKASLTALDTTGLRIRKAQLVLRK